MVLQFGGGRRGRFRGSTSLAEINIVPLVDVVLVLLIIFMLTAHVMEFGLEVEVPKVKPVREDVQDLPVIEMDKEGATYLNDKPVNINVMADTIRQRYQKAQGSLSAGGPQNAVGSDCASDRHARRSEAGCERGDAAGRHGGKEAEITCRFTILTFSTSRNRCGRR